MLWGVGGSSELPSLWVTTIPGGVVCDHRSKATEIANLYISYDDTLGGGDQIPAKLGTASSQAIDWVTQGTYNRAILYQAALSQTAGTEFEVTDVATNIIADNSRDALFSWVRIQLMVIYTGADFIIDEAALIRCDKDDATQNLNDSDVMEQLQKEGRILWRGLFACGDITSGGRYAMLKIEKYKVVLQNDEELRLLIRPYGSAADSGTYLAGLLEWREVGA